MLGDSIGKSKNKLPIVLKRKAGRTVQFSAPTFYEPPEQSFSSDEDDDGSNAGSHAEEAAEQQTTEEGKDVDDNAVVEPLKAGGSREQQAGQTISMVDSSADERIDGIEQNGYGARETNSEDAQVSEEGTSPRSRKGTVRNTDSFFKDDTVETRKINLTPSLLREDSSSSTSKSFENREVSRPCLGTSRVANSWSSSRLGKAWNLLTNPSPTARKAKMTRRGKRRKACSVDSSSERTRRAEFRRRRWRTRRSQESCPGHRFRARNQVNHYVRSNRGHRNHNVRPASYRSNRL